MALLFHLFSGTVLHLLQYKAGQISLISLDFIEILSFLIPFEPFREPLMRSQTVFIFTSIVECRYDFSKQLCSVNFNL